MDGLISVFPYKDGIQSAVKQLKYRFVTEMGASFVEATVKRVDSEVVDFFRKEKFSVVPVPLHKVRERWRGFNQAALLGKLLAGHWKIGYRLLLNRIVNTDALAEIKVGLTSTERKKLEEKYISVTQRKIAERQLIRRKKEKERKRQMRGAFELDSKFETENANILLVDDVWTSGATMLECCKTVKRGEGEKVWGFTFARSGG
jgi:predicted amidophosphoribosyltransferase